jgi:archaemetzincin
MNLIQVVPIGVVDQHLTSELCAGLSAELQVGSQVLTEALDPAPARHPERQQYHSTEFLSRLAALRPPEAWRLLGVTELDLYIPTLTFVFGEAQLGGGCAVVSVHRLRQEFYGLPPDPRLLSDRLLKEAVHELGHTMNLRHCDDYRCAMAPSHAVEWIDLKGSRFCPDCQARTCA